MNYKKLNELFTNLRNMPKVAKFVEEIYTNKIEGEGNQGEEGSFYRIYQLNEDFDNHHLKITYYTDSYGDGEAIESIKFVTPIEKTINTYKEI